MSGARDEFPPLLATAGFHILNAADLRLLCVGDKRFSKSKSRSVLMDRLDMVLAKLNAAGIVGELWIDGSFLTEKVDPDDVDLSLRIQAATYDNGTPEQRACMDWLSEIHDTEKIDGYLCIEWPAGHPGYAIGKDNHEYWKKQWGNSRAGVVKGIAVIQLSRGFV